MFVLEHNDIYIHMNTFAQIAVFLNDYIHIDSSWFFAINASDCLIVVDIFQDFLNCGNKSKMSTFEGVFVNDPWLQSQFTQVELRKLRTKVCHFNIFLRFFLNLT